MRFLEPSPLLGDDHDHHGDARGAVPLTGTARARRRGPRASRARDEDRQRPVRRPPRPPYARPQSGLQDADVIFEEQVEGSITRYAAVFQCREAPLVGDIRSARQIDIGILSELDAPLSSTWAASSRSSTTSTAPRS